MIFLSQNVIRSGHDGISKMGGKNEYKNVYENKTHFNKNFYKINTNTTFTAVVLVVVVH